MTEHEPLAGWAISRERSCSVLYFPEPFELVMAQQKRIMSRETGALSDVLLNSVLEENKSAELGNLLEAHRGERHIISTLR